MHNPTACHVEVDTLKISLILNNDENQHQQTILIKQQDQFKDQSTTHLSLIGVIVAEKFFLECVFDCC